MLDFSKYLNRVLEVNVEERWARVEPGIVLDDLRARVASDGLWFGPDPATHTHNTLGGMIGNNSCGMHAQFAGKTEENTVELDVLTYDGVRLTVGATSDAELDRLSARDDRAGEIYRGMRALRDEYAGRIRARFPDIPRRVSGYPLDQLLPENGFNVARALVGTECTCVIVLGAKVKLIPNPSKRCILVAGFKDIYEAGDRVPDVNAHKPIALEGLDDKLIGMMKVKHLEEDDLSLLPRGSGWLMCEFGSVDDRDAAVAQAKACEADLRQKGALDTKLIVDEAQQKRLWAIREAGLGATAKVPNHASTHPGWEDSACPPDRVGPYLRELNALFDKHGYHPALYGHFGQGCIHCRVAFDLESEKGVANWLAFLHEAAELVTRYGGSLSGEHGDGQARGALLHIMYGDEIVEAFRRFKALWVPAGRMNPGKVVDAYPIESNLRVGPHYRPREPKTHFSFEIDDHGSFAYAANRCVGVGDCRRHDGKKVMCPSYRVTREEKHSTRGRARLLFEMLEGSPLRGGWRSEAVKDALDLCLACKGCKGDCPVNVDMATYKAEFLAHYYEGRLRPVWAYAFGLIMYWAHLASRAPRVVNAVAHAPGVAALVKAAARMAPQRRVPLFSEETFSAWYARHRGVWRPNAGAKRVMLWPDTFNDHFHSETARHALEVLEHAGFDVVIPRQRLCCGRPLYDYGMLDLAKTFLHQIVDALRDDIEGGTPIVVLEPSCASVFRDELPNMLPNDHDARRLSAQVVTLAELLDREGWSPPPLERDARVHPHCHHHSVLGTAPDKRVMERMGVRAEWLDDGAAGWRARSDSRPGSTTTCRSSAASCVSPARARDGSSELIVSEGSRAESRRRPIADDELS